MLDHALNYMDSVRDTKYREGDTGDVVGDAMPGFLEKNDYYPDETIAKILGSVGSPGDLEQLKRQVAIKLSMKTGRDVEDLVKAITPRELASIILHLDDLEGE